MVETAICIFIKRWNKRNNVLSQDNLDSTSQPPRTLLSAILRVREANTINGRTTLDPYTYNHKSPSNQVICFGPNLYSNTIDCDTRMTRENNQLVPLNALATECLFFDKEVNRDQERKYISKWATASQKLIVHSTGR